MAGTEWRPVLNWYDFNIGQYVRFRQAAGWKKGHVSHLYDNSCTVTWNQASNEHNTRVYDLRNLQAER